MGGQVVLFEPGEVLMKHGEVGDCMFLIREGVVQVEVSVDVQVEAPLVDVPAAASMRVVAEHVAGATVGEMAFVLPEGRRTATVRAKTRVLAERYDRAAFERALSKSDPIVQAVVQTAIKNVQEGNKRSV